MSKTKFPWISTILFLIVLASTFFLFFFLSEPESRNKLFAFNLIYICFLEFLFFGFFTFTQILSLSGLKIRAASYPVWGTVLFTYVFAGLLIVLLYNFALDHLVTKKIYASVLLVLTVIMIIIAGFVLKVDRLQAESEDKLKEARIALTIPVEEFKILEKKFIRIVNEKSISIKTESNHRSIIEKLVNRLESIPPNMLDRNPVFISKMNQWLLELGQMISAIEVSENTEEEIKKLSAFITDCCDYTDSQKNLFRK